MPHRPETIGIHLNYRGVYARDVEFPSKIDKETWQKLKKLLDKNMSDAAHSEVDKAVALYADLRNTVDAQRAKSARRQLKRASKKVTAAISALDEIKGNDDVLECIAVGRDGRLSMSLDEQAEFRLVFQRFIAQMRELEGWLADVQDRVFDARPGPRGERESLLAFVNALNSAIRQFTGKTITRSRNEEYVTDQSPRQFALAAGKVENDKLNAWTLEEAIKPVVAEERDDGQISIFNWDVPRLLLKGK